MGFQFGRLQWGSGVSLAAGLMLTACAGNPPLSRPEPSVPARAPISSRPAAPPPLARALPPASSALADLPGWDQEDHLAALQAVRLACSSRPATDPAGVCLRAAWLDQPTEAEARAFLERNFRVEPVGEDGLLTGYFTPVYPARKAPDAAFSAPVRPRPRGDRFAVASDRAQIEAWPTDEALAWMRPEDLFFLQIQGSGVLLFEDGARLRAVFDGSNGLPFTAIAAPMRARGLLGDLSGGSIHDWLAQNRGPAAQAVMDLDRRYVFLRLQPDDGAPPSGAAGLRLLPGRSLAVDPSLHRMGELLWIDAQAGTRPTAFPSYRRLAVALDTGSAIQGPARADLYLGVGGEAGAEAGRIRHSLRLYRLRPIGPEEAAAGSPLGQ